MTDTLKTISPVDGRVYIERPLASAADISRVLEAARAAQVGWRAVPLADRCAMLSRAVDAFVANAKEIATEISWQMGRPIRHSPSEVRGFEERSRYMLQVAPEALAAVEPAEKAGFRRQIKREPLGVIAVIAPWNYPYLTAVNAILPALIAGNAVVLKHSHQTPLCAERFDEAFARAGVPAGVFQYLHLSHADTSRLMGDARVASVCFTGSVAGGRAVVTATACCGIKRIYVAAPRFDEFVAGVVDLTRQYRLGSPLDPETTLGPVVRTAAADAVRSQVQEAVARGARQLIAETAFGASKAGTPYLAPQVLVGVDHSMAIMREETFGPAVGIMRVESDEEAVRLMNDSDFGLTAAIYSADVERAQNLGDALETGTVFLNRCDYLDPALAWTGVKNSGRGCTLSKLGFEQLTRPKSYHFRLTT